MQYGRTSTVDRPKKVRSKGSKKTVLEIAFAFKTIGKARNKDMMISFKDMMISFLPVGNFSRKLGIRLRRMKWNGMEKK